MNPRHARFDVCCGCAALPPRSAAAAYACIRQKVHVASAACRQCKYEGCELSFLVCRRLTPDPEKGFFGVQTPTCIPTTGVTPDCLPNQTYMFNSPNETFSSECARRCDVCCGLKCDVVYCGSMRCCILAWHAMPSSGPAPQLHCALMETSVMCCAAYRAPCVNGTNVLGGYWYIGESVAAFLSCLTL